MLFYLPQRVQLIARDRLFENFHAEIVERLGQANGGLQGARGQVAVLGQRHELAGAGEVVEQVEQVAAGGKWGRQLVGGGCLEPGGLDRGEDGRSRRQLVGLQGGNESGEPEAERIVVELKDKIDQAGAWEAASAARALSADEQKINDAVLALMALGFKQIEAHDTIRAAQEKLGATASIEDLVRAALRKG